MRRTKLEQYVLRAIVGESFSMGEIMRGIPIALRGRSMGHEWKVDEYRRDQLLTLLDETPRAISREHTERGLEFFRSLHRVKCDCTGPQDHPYAVDAKYPYWRESTATEAFKSFHRDVIDDFSHFLFCGYYDVATKSWCPPDYRATYHVVAHNGEQFTYTPVPWQSGLRTIIH